MLTEISPKPHLENCLNLKSYEKLCLMKTYVLFILHNQININCKKCIIVVILIFA